MLFSSNEFLFLFLPAAWIAWRAITVWLPEFGVLSLAFLSLAFYAFDQPKHLPLMLLVAFVGFIFISREGRVRSAATVAIGIAILLGLLAYFKYFEFLVTNLSIVGLGELPWWQSPLLPVGISFYVLEAVSSIVDTRRQPSSSALVRPDRYLLFISFFPHLIAGPIVRVRQLTEQFITERMVASIDAPRGMLLIAIGLFLKVGLADRLAPFVDGVHSNVASASAPMLWCAAWAYALQIYFDFNGYCVMAVGLGLLFGITLPFNFNSPYKATSIVDFWRRWNITLSLYLRDYLYYSLGGRAAGTIRWLANLLITMLVSGLWHGAGWTFVAWGGLHGIALMCAHATRNAGIVVPRMLGWAMTLAFTTLAWIPFRSSNLAEAWTFFVRLFSGGGWKRVDMEPTVLVALGIGTAIALLAPNARDLSERFTGKFWHLAGAGALLGIAVMLQLYAGDTYRFIYFRF